MKTISQVYENVNLKSLEDWICHNEDAELYAEELTQKEIGEVAKEFNTIYYWKNLERLQSEYEDEAEGEGEDELRVKPKPLSKIMKVKTEYHKMFLNSPPLTEEFKKNYEAWLEEEVWGYYD